MSRSWTNYYDRLAKSSNNPVCQSGYVVDGSPLNESVFDNWVAAIQRHLNISSSISLLDIGCGSGLFLKRFSKWTKKLYGVDPSAAILLTAHIVCPEANLRVGHALDAKFEQVAFDIVFCNSVFLYFESLSYARDVLSYCISLLAEEGKIWVGDLPYPSSEMQNSDFRRTGNKEGLSLQHYPVEYLTSICKEFGVHSTILEQSVLGKPTNNLRYDLLIEKRM